MKKHQHDHEHTHHHNHDCHDHDHHDRDHHDHNHETHASSCGHNHGNSKTPLYLFFLGVILFIASSFVSVDWIKNSLLVISLIAAGHHIIIEGIQDMFEESKRRKKFTPNVHLLMCLAAIGALLIQEYHEASLLILIFAGAHFLEEYAEGRSRKEITSLLKMNPTTARLIAEDGKISIVDVATLKVGDQLQVLNGDQVPTDGIIESGSSSIDQSAITGESIPVEKMVGDNVFGGTINGTGTFVMRVSKDSSETVLAKIVTLVSQTQSNISKTAAFIKRLEPIYVTIILIVAPIFFLVGATLLNWGYQESFYRTMVFLIGASPCALAATDIPATLSAISQLARHGVLFKGGSYLSNVADIQAVAFDKTGTLTEGKPIVTDVYFEPAVSSQQAMYQEIIVAMEKQSNHPLAQAMINYFQITDVIEVVVDNVIGVGLKSTINQVNYTIGKPTSFNQVGGHLQQQTELYEQQGKTVVYFGDDQKIIAIIAIQDVPKASATQAISYFKQEQIHTVMITGDALKTGQAIGKQIGIDEVKGNVLPEDKSNIINTLKQQYHTVAMIGDGVNDAPALVAADIGVAMGDGTDIAIDVADAVLMKNDLMKFVYTHQVAKKLRKIVWQNIIFAMAVVVFLIVVNILGLMNMSYAVLIHEGSTLVVILNGLRMLKKVN